LSTSAKLSGHVCNCLLPSRLLWRKCRTSNRRKDRDKSPTTSITRSTMGHGPSTSSSKMKSRTDSFVNGHPDPRNNDESFSTQNEDSSNNDHALPVGSRSLRSKSYLSYRRSTASLSKLFQKRKWKQRRGSISASFNINENDIKVRTRTLKRLGIHLAAYSRRVHMFSHMHSDNF